MPFADPEKRRANSKKWRKKKIAEGYGKALYARRAQRYRNEEILRVAVLDAISHIRGGEIPEALKLLQSAIKRAPEVGKPIEYMPQEGE